MLCDGYETLVSGKPMTEVIASTKKEHKQGEKFDGIGGFSARGVTDRVEDAKNENLVPIGLLQGATARRDIPIDTLITYDDVDLDTSQTIYQLRQKQDQLGLS
jgi:predicted homoserine dehydrogenase-like protein